MIAWEVHWHPRAIGTNDGRSCMHTHPGHIREGMLMEGIGCGVGKLVQAVRRAGVGNRPEGVKQVILVAKACARSCPWFSDLFYLLLSSDLRRPLCHFNAPWNSKGVDIALFVLFADFFFYSFVEIYMLSFVWRVIARQARETPQIRSRFS